MAEDVRKPYGKDNKDEDDRNPYLLKGEELKLLTKASDYESLQAKNNVDIYCDRRLWIGNLEAEIKELAMIKLCQKYGNIIRFDMLYHKSGPDRGKSKGYCFVTYEKHDEAADAMHALDGKKALNRKLAVKWAHTEVDRKERTLMKIVHSASSSGAAELAQHQSQTKDFSKEDKIRAIEAKLKMMESEEERINSPVKRSRKC